VVRGCLIPLDVYTMRDVCRREQRRIRLAARSFKDGIIITYTVRRQLSFYRIVIIVSKL
jgi:hypothetical protein